ncbi:hypothetical protein BDN70DRAFT_708802 [Pholiota conissans]|uniref:Uncharacterized protein n=1 Tax=Pholiota conissans TaxID=109636 RepID=A0A9P5Z457_9AGAR|nr:hypothetical protein BDN70DRAFT_708802 [Pholiota conissans]
MCRMASTILATHLTVCQNCVRRIMRVRRLKMTANILEQIAEWRLFRLVRIIRNIPERTEGGEMWGEGADRRYCSSQVPAKQTVVTNEREGKPVLNSVFTLSAAYMTVNFTTQVRLLFSISRVLYSPSRSLNPGTLLEGSGAC